MLKKIVLSISLAVGCSNIALATTEPVEYDANSPEKLKQYIIALNSAPVKDLQTAGGIWARITPKFEVLEVSPEVVKKHEQFYASKSKFVLRTLKRGEPYLYHIVSELEKRNMPMDLVFLPFIESSFVTKAKSPVGASGIWQFMPATGKNFGLKQSDWYDGRNDFYAATDAALNYLQFLYNEFQDWPLAIAAYNCGEGRVAREIAKAKAAGLEPTFDNLNLPQETRNYVPKLLAVRNIIANSGEFGIDLFNIEHKPYFDVFALEDPIDLKAIAKLAKVSEDELMRLNPGQKTPVWIPDHKRKLLLPTEAVERFLTNLKKADKASLLSWQVYKSVQDESLADLAARTTVSANDIKKANGIKGNSVAKGQILLVPKDFIAGPSNNSSNIELAAYKDEPIYLNKVAYTQAKSVKNKTKVTQLKVKPGMTLSSIARDYNTTVDSLKKTNKLKSNSLRIGQVLSVQTSSNPAKKTNSKQAKTIVHEIKKGDTLISLAKKYSVSVKDIQSLNKHISPKSLKPGVKIKVKG